MSSEEKELLDYCRVKNISEKGYGFLTSLYYDQNVFFHFNGIKEPNVKEKLEKLKRGAVYFFYTSKPHKERRRINKLWLSIGHADKELIPDFIDRIKYEFSSGKTNPFEVAYVIKQLRENELLEWTDFNQILLSQKLLRTPSILLALLTDKELKKKKKDCEELIAQLEADNIETKTWIQKLEFLLRERTN